MLLFTTGTINEADAGSVGLTMAETIRDDLVLHAAWELTEEFTPASGNVRWYVFKNLATASGLSDDFYLVMGRTLATGDLRFAICEEYDQTTHTMSFFAPGFSTNQFAMDSLGRRTATYVLGTAALPGGESQPRYQNWVPGGTSIKYWIIADDDAFTVAFNGTPNAFVYAGAYEPLTPLTIDLPLMIVGSSSSEGGITRNPSVASITIYNCALSIKGAGGTSIGNGPLLGFRGDLRNNDKLQGNYRAVAEQGITIYDGISNPEPLIGWALGKNKRMRVGGNTTPTGVAFGDAYVLDGNLWVPWKPDDSRIWDTGVAAS